MCGGTCEAHPCSSYKVGLSPRVRGNPVGPRAPTSSGRSIPACAGEPSGPRCSGRCGPVYPRVCGGTTVNPRSSAGSAGLSPRVRGNLPGQHQVHPTVGSIPACAGEPLSRDLSIARLSVYPRVCGGTYYGRAEPTGDRGLSPRVRGNLWSNNLPFTPCRSIPACAGEPFSPALPSGCVWVYPRVCGGTCPIFSDIQNRPGLSPRVRGNPFGPYIWYRYL